MELECWWHKSCAAEIGVGDDWATLYLIQSREKRKGHAEELLIEAKKYYKEQGKELRGSVALNSGMKKLYQKLDIKEYN